ncbi:putative 5-formyltetrahydrofolate cyclo-ligase [Caenibius tardaugens NBRC 16725]|uniref:5-formyltetrahydrofolate cyclo-ligase n=1 Tax=Caenibius tardaugens NBRC 16725 TaxID=1219035 RepID=U2YHH8_9SPHN|nr:5-formyltetrahydrofolate cyclo-ligase [Caenibius tardaugens]GAD47327.1 putative 5-formyltetrahydrofolate cyclo-ligase [Caenibius tardaugens NBRC 16725]
MAEISKDALRQIFRNRRRAHVAALPSGTRALLFHRPPRPIVDLIPEGAQIGLYRATPNEAPAAAYARFFQEAGHRIALPRFSARNEPMGFAEFADPFDESDLVQGPYGMAQPPESALAITPDVLFVPLLGFTADGHRLGQGGGHYDRWLEAHPGTIAIGLAWDCQLNDELPLEPHDRHMTAIITPTRLYGPY